MEDTDGVKTNGRATIAQVLKAVNALSDDVRILKEAVDTIRKDVDGKLDKLDEKHSKRHSETMVELQSHERRLALIEERCMQRPHVCALELMDKIRKEEPWDGLERRDPLIPLHNHPEIDETVKEQKDISKKVWVLWGVGGIALAFAVDQLGRVVSHYWLGFP
jgi:hypothetical protein